VIRNDTLAAPRLALQTSALAGDAAASLVPQLAAAEPEHDLAGRPALQNLELLADNGLLQLNVPESFGGFGESLGGTLETLRTLAQGSPSAALMLAMHTSILANYLIDPRHVPVSERASFLEQRAWAFNEAARGKRFGVANSEPGASGDVKQSRAQMRDGRLFGVKSFCSMGTHADYFMAAARDESEHVRYWLVRNEHVSVESEWDAIGMRSSESVSLRFDGAPVVAPLAYRGLLDGVNNRHWSTLSFTAIFIGIAESLLDDVLSPRAPMLQQTAATELHLTLQACRAFLRQCAAIEPDPATDDYRREVRDCKLFVTRALAQHASNLFTTLGGSAYRFASPVSRKVRDLLAGPLLRPPVGVAFDEVFRELVAL
jgi:alkylation response protein AidB-like acyl-CoA dehydrogenase